MDGILRLQNSAAWSDWHWQLDHAIRTVGELSRALGFSDDSGGSSARTAARYPLLISPHYLSLIRSASFSDPVFRQCVPDMRELSNGSGLPDPLAEDRDMVVPGLVHRYPDRVLLIVTNRCAVHCRHCMRKRCWGQVAASGRVDLQACREYLSHHPGVREVIISGGDPLLLEDSEIDDLLGSLTGVGGVEMLRIGSRVPVALPQRLTADLCRILGKHGPIWLATHFNHAQELSPASASGLERVVRAGVPVVNQTVLLRGVNDDSASLRSLFTGLLRLRVKPYYLFHGDPVAGTMHFRTGVERGLQIMAELRGYLSGLALPAFALDLPGGGGKVRLEPTCAAGVTPDGLPLYRDFRGDVRAYP